MISRGTGYVKGTHPQAGQRLKAHVKYIGHRTGGDRDQRELFGKDEETVSRLAVTATLLEHSDRYVAFHKVLLSPDELERDGIDDWQQWTREVLRNLEVRLGLEMTWYAVVHQNTENPHVHVVVAGQGINALGAPETVRLFQEDYQALDQFGHAAADAEHVRVARDAIRLDERFEDEDLLLVREGIWRDAPDGGDNDLTTAALVVRDAQWHELPAAGMEFDR